MTISNQIGFVDLPEKYRKDRFLNNLGMAFYRVAMINDFGIDNIEQAINLKRECNSLKLSTTRINIRKEYIEFYEFIKKACADSMIDTVYVAILEIESNKNLYK